MRSRDLALIEGDGGTVAFDEACIGAESRRAMGRLAFIEEDGWPLSPLIAAATV